MTDYLTSVEQAADLIVERTDGSIVLGLPLGLGKPNSLVNALYRRAADDPRISLTIATALSLGRPQAAPGLQRRFLQPFVERVYGDYEELQYLHDSRAGRLPDNVQVIEFYVQPAAELANPYAQQNYISSNYTHIARDMLRRGINVLAQAVAPGADPAKLSLSCNPEMTLDMLPAIAQRRDAGQVMLTVGQLHPDLPYMPNSAEVDADIFDLVIDDPACKHTLISTPNMPVGMAEHFIGLAASALVRDGGTLQIGIGALGDALAGALLLRHRDNASWRKMLEACHLSETYYDAFEEGGDLGPFRQGLYGCSEMFTYGLFRLLEEGIISREVEGPGGQPVHMTGGFFLGPRAFYEGLRSLPESELRKIDMTNISFVNALYGDETLKRSQRQHGRFINTAFSVTLLGAGVADQLDDGRIVSGVGGQYNFVAQAHELEGARSVILVRATRSKGGVTTSNIVWNYGHTTIPRHLRDIVVTEYGVADLRGKTDAEVISAMLSIADSRFQEELMETAKSAGKLPRDYRLPRAYTRNTPERLKPLYRRYRKQGFFDEFPLGCDFTDTEQTLLHALTWLRAHNKPRDLLDMARTGRADDEAHRRFQSELERMGLAQPSGVRERLFQQLLLKALEATAQ